MSVGAPCALCDAPHPYDPKRGYRHSDGHAYQPIAANTRRLIDEIPGEVVLGIARICPHCRCLVNAARDDMEHHLSVCSAREQTDGSGRGSDA